MNAIRFITRKIFLNSLFLILLMIMVSGPTAAVAKSVHRAVTKQVVIPAEDRFTPFGLTIHVGDTVRWTNRDSDDHRIVSDNFFTTAGNKNTDHLLPGTGSTGGTPSTFSLKFKQAGLFVYYCSIHSELDSFHQPKNVMGIADTPMMGVIAVNP